MTKNGQKTLKLLLTFLLIHLTKSITHKIKKKITIHTKPCKICQKHKKHIDTTICKIPKKKIKLILERGEEGEEGPEGNKGPRGDIGDRGETGENGEIGDEGTKGDDGPVGENGNDGKDGECISGENGDEGEDGKDADELFCYCPDETFFYFCCLMENKNDPDWNCKKEKKFLKECEGNCLKIALEDKDNECEDGLKYCNDKCNFQCPDCGASFSKAICEESCIELKEVCLLKKGCIKEQEENCKDRCSTIKEVKKKKNCQKECEPETEQVGYQTTCEKLFPIFFPYKKYKIQDNLENGKFISSEAEIIQGIGSENDEGEYATKVKEETSTKDWIILLTKDGYKIGYCGEAPSKGLFLNVSEAVKNHVNLGAEVDQTFNITLNKDGCFNLSFYDAGNPMSESNGLGLGIDNHDPFPLFLTEDEKCWSIQNDTS